MGTILLSGPVRLTFMTDLVDTTEMYLRTILDLEEEHIVPLRARISERLGHSGPTVSQTIGRMERDPWTDNEDQPRETWRINARSVGILPYRIESVTLSPKPQEAEPKAQDSRESTAPKETRRKK